MAKKFVRGVTGVDDIEKFDKSLTNVNDIISDGQNTYVHTKKGKNEIYYNITNAVNQVQSSDDTLTITKENDTIKISNKSLATKQELAKSVNQVQSSDNTLTITKQNDTVTIANKTLATKQELATKQNTLIAGSGIDLNNNTISLIHTPQSTVDCNNIITTRYLKVGDKSTNLPEGSDFYGILSVVRIGDVVQQTYQTYKNNGLYIRTAFQIGANTQWTAWQKIVTQPVR